VEDPGTTPVEIASYNLRTCLDWAKLVPKKCRVIATASGNELGWKAVEIYDVSRETFICDVEWGGTGINRTLRGLWYDFPLKNYRDDDVITIRVRGSSATEDITLYVVDLQILYYG